MAKRRAAQQASESESEGESPSRRRRLNHDADSSSGSESPPPNMNASSALQTIISKLVRLALSAEYARIPIRRAEIGTKVLGENGARQFKAVFEGAQMELQGKFGMQMVMLPSREKDKMGLTQRRAAQTSQKSQSTSSNSWVLISILPDAYKSSKAILQPARAPSLHSEATYTALYTFAISLILLNSGSIPEAKLERYLKRTNADAWTPIGQTDKVLQRMVKDGYIVKTRDTSSGEEVAEFSVGPRGKVEVGEIGVAGLVRKMYEGSDVADEALDKKLERSLGITTNRDGPTNVPAPVVENGDQAQTQVNGEGRRRGRPRRNKGKVDDD